MSIKHNNNVTKKNLPSKTTEYESISPNKLLVRDYPKILNPREDLYKNIKLRNGIKAKPKPLTKSQRKIAIEILDDISAPSRGCLDAKNRGDHKLTNRMHGGQNYDGWNSIYITEQGGSPGVMRIFYKETNDGILWRVVWWH